MKRRRCEVGGGANYDSIAGLESPLETDLEVQHFFGPLVCHVDVNTPLLITSESTDAAAVDMFV